MELAKQRSIKGYMYRYFIIPRRAWDVTFLSWPQHLYKFIPAGFDAAVLGRMDCMSAS